MKINKGYSLVELLVSIAIFAIVSIGVISIMSSTMSSYDASTKEVNVQEDAQIVANQLEELLCDATSINASAGTFTSQGKTYTITSSPLANPAANISIDDGSGAVVLSQNSNLEFTGWNSGADNKVSFTLKVAASNTPGDKSYTLSRDVYFRNTVENSDIHDIKYLKTSISTPSPTPTPSTITVDFNRYDEINLTAEYGICYITDGASIKGGLTTNGGTATNSLSNSYFTVTQTANALTPVTTDFEYKLKGTDTMNATFSSALAGNTVEFIGYKDAACTDVVTLNINVKDIAIVNTNNVYQHQDTESTNNGIHTWITVEGLDVNKGIAAGKVSVTYTPQLKNGGTTYSGSAATMTAKTTVDKGNNSIGGLPYGNHEVILGLQPDPFGNGIILCSANETITSKCNGLQGNEDGYTLHFVFSLTNGSSSKTGEQLGLTDFKFDILGTGF